ncbi:MAG: hypothetical protein ACREH6_06510 [Geminicoccaceae bacterium]
MPGPQPRRIVTVVTNDRPPADRRSAEQLIASIAKGTWHDFVTTNRHTFGKATKFGAGLVVGGKVASEMGAVTPLKWALRGFGPLPAEFTSTGAIQVFEYTTLQRAMLVARAAAAKFVLVTVAYESGVLVGSIINQKLSEETQDAIGGTIDEIVNHGGWKLLFKHPFGIGM